MKLFISGGVGRKHDGAFSTAGDCDEGIAFRLDLETGAISDELRHRTSLAHRPDAKSSDLFKACARTQDTLIVPTKTEVLICDIHTQAILRVISHPLMNDVHHAFCKDNELFVVSTGVDALLVFDYTSGAYLRGFGFNEKYPVSGDVFPDYREINDLKPHQNHFNYSFFHQDELWMTSLRDGGAFRMADRKFYKISNEPIHDGVERDGLCYFTSVNGTVIVTDLKEYKETIILNDIEKTSDALGWCRGILPLDDGTVLVGFSILRRTKHMENLRWLAATVTSSIKYYPYDTRLVRYDLNARRKLQTYDLQSHSMAAVFGIIAV